MWSRSERAERAAQPAAPAAPAAARPFISAARALSPPGLPAAAAASLVRAAPPPPTMARCLVAADSRAPAVMAEPVRRPATARVVMAGLCSSRSCAESHGSYDDDALPRSRRLERVLIFGPRLAAGPRCRRERAGG